ncbi:MAG: saccharopine dehydrogenase NADP-binding domain-containing protein [Gemmatimonadota bacterium]
MSTGEGAGDFLLYGATGFVGGAMAEAAVAQGLRPILAGRDARTLERRAGEMGVGYRVFSLDDPLTLDAGLDGVSVVLHCAGPYIHTARQMVQACLRTGTHYLDITGEIPVFADIAERDDEAIDRGVMLLPGAGFDVVPTDCLALHLKQRLPSATHLAIAFRSRGPAGLPPGTQRTAIEMLPYGGFVRRAGKLVKPARGARTRIVDFGTGPTKVAGFTWGDIFTAYHSTGIPDIDTYLALPASLRRSLAVADAVRPLFRIAVVRRLLARGVRPGPTPETIARTSTHVWGQVEDESGRTATTRLHGPEAGVVWTVRAALATVRRALAGDAPAGYQTPARAYGADFVLELEGVTREDLD